MQTANEIRRTFLDFFEKNGHTVVNSSPLVPRNDPTLMFTNAGMVQFKNVFTGIEKRDYVRAASSQKCVRAGGKHNDLDNVGYTARHHTFFEMLGNFSFGDYFKDLAIEHAWNLITKDFGIDKSRLLVTVYHDDDQAADAWKKIAGLPESRIIRIPTSDNFWAMGDTGPCGPCSEIFYDHGEHIFGGPPGSPDQDGDRFIEIWNLVFMQFEQVDKETRIPLPKPSIDTGMGLERLAALLQGKHDNYDVDLLRALIEASAEASNTDPDGPHKVSHRVVADHLRSSSFLIADGVLPSNEGRGYVLRRIMRRAMRHAHLMGCTEPLLHKLVPALTRQMGEAYPELVRANALITETLKLEETRFKVTLDKGLKLLDDEITRIGSGQKLAGEVAFKLYDTYGFPLDLTQDALKAKGIGVDTDGFASAMERQRAEARKAWAGSGDTATETVWFELREKLGASEFLGYDAEQAEGKIVALVENGKVVEAVHPGHQVAVIANQTPFYGESGGQMGDTGVITLGTPGTGGKATIAVTDTQKKLGDLIVHFGTVEGGPVAVGEDAHFAVESTRRDATRGHHSATHLLHAALRDILGDHVTQKGSQVGPDRLRFDFAHTKALSAEETRAVEAEVNRRIRLNAEVATKVMTPDDAIKAGAMALFGEKYGEEVRVVSMGDLSTELCGGTHANRTGDIGGFKIVAESAVASGVRRIEAVTGPAFLAWAQAQEDLLAKAADTLKAAPADLPARIAGLMDDRRKLERELAEVRKQLATGGGQGAATKTVNGITYAGKVLSGVPAKDLKGMADEIKKQIGSGIIALVSDADGKASIVVCVTEDLTSKHSAVDLVRIGSEALGGKGGGGRPDMAQAGGPDASAAQAAVDRIEQALGG
ncbi:alanine--tRNA ligase [Paramagnetospirillum magneticum]|uniref:Alanine--tRNA ligase n=1 Tax=Paramagnetospirillum magneticum (strain ATCC 700264 / AMB-1) TaxID=342108 RepID=SYA_PARM1|nr:alanine--tRNA ligase [Paramagnetospirillum magneticum]Q2W1D9.1 RecName: Full=Alanine--tRNA ligase; AltName: Full=Alanyl-tRNA synthetase; Short=AlaRS [Paramagnetospirillum magneticum AMB-1]BAE52336.1 Alanyl-tRNA synthetase [Paramagnetospirillum magneticum AMB-1]